jgi:tetratricopeptide (TPR) repeat protein
MFVWAAMRWRAVGGEVRGTEFYDNPLVAASAWERVWTALSVLSLGIGKLLVPRAFSADYSPPKLGIVASPLSAGVLAGAILLAGLPIVALLLRRRLPAVSFWIVLFLLAWLPVSNLVVVIGTLFGERLLYLPSAAFCALLGYGLWRLPRRWMAVCVLAVLAPAYASLTWHRNADWRSNATLFAHEYRHRPASARSLSNHAYVLQDSDPGRALEVYGEMLAVAPDYAPGRLGLGTFLLKRGDAAAALEHLERADELRPGDVSTLLNLGSAYADLRRYGEAAGCWRRLLAADPDNRKARLNLEKVERLSRE